MILTLFIVLAVTLLMGIPVGFSIGISTMLAVAVGGSVPVVIVTQKMVDGINSFPLMALPLFVLSGVIMAYGSTPRIMALVNLLLRKKRWGLGSADIYGCAAFGTISGSGVATTAAIGSVIAPEMVKQGYPKGYVASLTGGAGTLGAIIPPSIGFVVYAQVANVSISDMFMAGIIPGIVTAILLATMNKFFVKKYDWIKGNTDYYDKMTFATKRKIVLDAILPLLMPIFILGGVLSGIVTPTEAATVATVYALILAAFVYKELSLKKLFKVFVDSVISSAAVLIIISAAAPFAWVMTSQGITSAIASWVLSLSHSIVIVYGAILVINLILGTFMETLALILITTPMFLPILVSFGVDPVAFGITQALALGVGAVTPPLAVTLFTACKIVKIRVDETFPWVIYVCIVMFVGVLLSAIFPIMSTFLPSIL